MPDRKQFQSSLVVSQELQRLLDESKGKGISEEELREQRVSFAYGNAPAASSGITKDSVRYASEHIKIK